MPSLQNQMLLVGQTLSGLIGLFSVGYFCDKLKTIKKVLFPSLIITTITGTIAILFNKGIAFYLGFFLMGNNNALILILHNRLFNISIYI